MTNLTLFSKKTNVQNLRDELKRRANRRVSMLKAFEENGTLTTGDMNRFGNGCSSRLKELRREGHVIVAQYEKPGEYLYTYIGRKDEQ